MEDVIAQEDARHAGCEANNCDEKNVDKRGTAACHNLCQELVKTMRPDCTPGTDALQLKAQVGSGKTPEQQRTEDPPEHVCQNGSQSDRRKPQCTLDHFLVLDGFSRDPGDNAPEYETKMLVN